MYTQNFRVSLPFYLSFVFVHIYTKKICAYSYENKVENPTKYI